MCEELNAVDRAEEVHVDCLECWPLWQVCRSRAETLKEAGIGAGDAGVSEEEGGCCPLECCSTLTWVVMGRGMYRGPLRKRCI